MSKPEHETRLPETYDEATYRAWAEEIKVSIDWMRDEITRLRLALEWVGEYALSAPTMQPIRDHVLATLKEEDDD